MPLHFDWRLELHPVLVHFPIALLSFALLLDAYGWLRKSEPFRRAGLYCLVAGTLGALAGVLSGLVTPEAGELGRGEGLGAAAGFFSGSTVRVHEHWAYLLLLVAAVWLAVRLLAHYGRLRAPALSLGLGVLTLAVLVATGYYGGEITYARRAGFERPNGPRSGVQFQRPPQRAPEQDGAG